MDLENDNPQARTAPYSIHPVTGAIVDANRKSVLIPLTSAYGAEDAKALTAQVVALLNQRELH